MTGRRETADLCIVGGGPAGAALAIRLARLGFRAVLIERGQPRRGHRGESLTPGVSTQLDLLGARKAVERAGFAEFRRVRTLWEGAGAALREFDREPGMLIERALFAAALRDVARTEGVRVIEPATLRERLRDGDSWHLRIESDAASIVLDATFLAFAGGRAASAANGRRLTGPRTLAVSAVWRGPELPAEPVIETGAEGWYWGMPLPDGSYCTTVFADPRQVRRDPHERLPAALRRLLAGSRLLARCCSAELIAPVEAAAATPYLATMPADRHAIRVGEAALALDPLSSSGVQRAMQSAFAAAAVVNTLLRRPSEAAGALAFYEGNLAAAADRHRRWAAALYRAAALGRDTQFWRNRITGPDDAPAVGRTASPAPRPDLPVSLASEARLAATPCIVGDFVATRTALHHPRLDQPVAFVGGHELAPLLGGMRPEMTAGELVMSWSGRVALRPALAIVGWMLDTGVLVASRPDRHADNAVRNPI